MKKSMKFATALAGAAVVVVGGTAFTNAAAGFDSLIYNGYGSTTVTGVTVTDTDYTYESGTADISSVTWKLGDQITSWTPYTIVGKVGATAGECTPTAYDDDPATVASIACTWAEPVSSGNVTLSVTSGDLTP